ncbi:MAG: MEDS domain-containing protein [Thermoleophilia bacterium]
MANSDGIELQFPEYDGVNIDDLSVPGTHVCLIYDNEEERQDIVLRFIEAGIKAGERVAYFAESMRDEEVRSWLEARGVDIPETGRFDVIPAREVYCPDGTFSIEAMMETWRVFDRETAMAGFSGCRATGETTWSRDVPGGDRIAEYCARLNDVLAGSRLGALCQYDSRRFDGATLLDVLRVHPLMLVGSQVVRNPYYVGASAFLALRDLEA